MRGECLLPRHRCCPPPPRATASRPLRMTFDGEDQKRDTVVDRGSRRGGPVKAKGFFSMSESRSGQMLT